MSEKRQEIPTEATGTEETRSEAARTPETRTKKTRERRGIVIKNRMDKTVVVEVTRKVRHPSYHKFVTRRARYRAHDEQNVCQIGDEVIMEETRPLSKTKRWRVKEVTEKATGV